MPSGLPAPLQVVQEHILNTVLPYRLRVKGTDVSAPSASVPTGWALFAVNDSVSCPVKTNRVAQPDAVMD